MTKTLDEMIAVMQAAREGKKIEYRVYNEEKWYEYSHPEWDWTSYDYRVAPEQPETVESVLLDAVRKIASTDLSGCANMTTAEIFGALSRMHETARVAIETAERILGRDEGR